MRGRCDCVFASTTISHANSNKSMKKIIVSIIASIIATACFAGQPETATTTTEQTLFGDLGGLFAARQASLAVYPSYDPYITVGGVKKPWGFGAALLYPLSDYAFAGVRLDFLGSTFWAPSAVVGAKYTLKNMMFTPTVFTVGGLIMPLGGAGTQNREVNAVTGIGVTAVLWKDKTGNFSANAFIEGEKWTNFDGAILHPGVAVAIKF
jgi:hypothetical protein